MKKQTLLSEKNRKRILIELETSKKKFVELKRILNLESNLLSYNLNLLLKGEFISKDKLYFSLTDKAKYLMPYIHKSNDPSLIPMPCVAVIVMKDGKILRRTKSKEPGKGKNIFIGGKIELGEDILAAAKRHVMDKTSIGIKNLRTICINNYISKKSKINTHYVVFFIIAEPIGEPENAKWMEPKGIKRNVYPDNKFVIETMLKNRKIRMISSIYNETTKKFKVVNIS